MALARRSCRGSYGAAARGFTLLELLAVVAIVGVLSAIAYPLYRGYVEDAAQAQALADLRACALAMEAHFTVGFTYAGADTAGVCPAASPPDGTPRYAITVEDLSATTYTLRATPIGEDCASDATICIELNQRGTQTLR